MITRYLLAICLFIHSLSLSAVVIGVAGGTGSGKTTVANKINASFEEEVLIISQDSYYKDLSHLTKEKRSKVNFDHPDAIDFNLLVSHLKLLKNGETVEQPIYNFCTHSREKETHHLEPNDFIIIEGILLLAMPEVREQCDLKIFVDTEDDIRFIRRLKRDMSERGRSLEGVIEQYQATVRPMHKQFVVPSKQYADLIIPEGGENLRGVGCIVAGIREMIGK